jgi:hypothetical protein
MQNLYHENVFTVLKIFWQGTSGTGTAHPSGTPEFISGAHVAQSLVFSVAFCKSLAMSNLRACFKLNI